MSAIDFRVVAPLKAKQFNYEKVWFPHPTDLILWIPELYPDFQWDSTNLESVVVNNKLAEMRVFRKGSDYYILENDYIKMQRVLA